MKKHLLSIIHSTFEKEYFLDQGSITTEENLLKQIEIFNSSNPDAIPDFLTKLRINFPNAEIENFTQFFNRDRCIRFLVQINENLRFVCQLSIYGFFTIYQRPYIVENEKFIYEKIEFINKGESEICDLMFNCADVLSEPIAWINKEILNEPVFDFSIPEIGHSYQIKIADLIFTDHYI